MATILQRYYIGRAESFYFTLNTKQTIPREFQILEPRQGRDGINLHLSTFLDDINNATNSKDGLPLLDTIIKKFDNQFCLEQITQINDDDLTATLKKLYKTINDLKLVVMKSCCSRDYVWSDFKFDPTMYIKEFGKEYRSDDDFKQLVYLIQAYHFLRLTYQGKLQQVYSRKTISPILDRLKEYIDRLKSIENHISVVRTINDD